MNHNIKVRWMAALRSMRYPQTKESLRDDNGFCCLGVLCDLHAKEFGKEWTPNESDIPRYMGHDTSLPPEVQQWAGLEVCDPMIGPEAASVWNDQEDKTFPEIADLIERYL